MNRGEAFLRRRSKQGRRTHVKPNADGTWTVTDLNTAENFFDDLKKYGWRVAIYNLWMLLRAEEDDKGAARARWSLRKVLKRLFDGDVGLTEDDEDDEDSGE